MNEFIEDLSGHDSDYTWYRTLPFEERRRAHRHATDLLATYEQILTTTAEQISSLIAVSGTLANVGGFGGGSARQSTELAHYLSLANRLEERGSMVARFVTAIKEDLLWLDNVVEVPDSVHDALLKLECFSCGDYEQTKGSNNHFFLFREAGERTNHQAWVKLCWYCWHDHIETDSADALNTVYLTGNGFRLKPDADVATSPIAITNSFGKRRWYLMGAEPGSLIEVKGGGQYDENGTWTTTPPLTQAADVR